MHPPIPLTEAARVAALHRLGVLDQPPAADLEGLTRLAAYVTGAPVSAVSFIDSDRHWTAAATGTACGALPRGDSLRAHTIAADDLVHVPDASADPRFADNPFVTGEHDQVRLYVGVPLHDPDGHPVGSLCVLDPQARQLDPGQLAALRDIAGQAEHLLELRRQQQRLLDVLAEVDHHATRDPLTGLLNRRMLLDRLTLALTRAERTQRAPTVFFVDLDAFKQVNDTLGHDAGDQVLTAVARLLEAAVRPSDTVARLGGDEFVVVCEDLPASAVDIVARRLRDVTVRAGSGNGWLPRVRLSVGAFTTPLPATAPDVLDAADRRMYADKHQRRAG